MNRRRFITGAASLLTAPALVRASSLDYVPRGLVLPENAVITPKNPFITPSFIAKEMLMQFENELGDRLAPHRAAG